MKLTKTKNIELHNYVDYTIGAFLLFSPFLFSMESNSIESKIIVTVGLAVILSNTITKHRFGLAKIISKKIHLKIDLFLGWFLAVSPFLFGFFGSIVMPHFLFGSVLILNAFFLPFSPKKNRYSVIMKKERSLYSNDKLIQNN